MSRASLLLATTASVLAGVLAGTGAVADEAHGPHWSYSGATGPEHWAEEDAAFAACGSGRERHQSPINIDGAPQQELPPIEFHYQPTPLTVTDTGHSFQVNAVPGAGGITVGGEHYDLVQFHFHRPSEETFQGHHYSMVAHLVHKNAQGQLAVVAVQIRKGQENDFLKPIFDNFPARGAKEKSVAGASVDLQTFVPGKHGYYTYEGSLTTPPCSEGVRWFELKSSVEASAAQVQEFAVRYPHNARPTQALNGRSVQQSRD
ncbi:MAG TPA: carbonic anhydrase family protein [Steroidobacteraceae bacterium]|jgi:carbonic anhydrase